MTDLCLIVGAGQAGLSVAQSLRERGYRGRIVLAGDEGSPPYQRPPLSKKFLAGEVGEERLHLKPAAFYEAQSIDLRLGLRVTGLDLARGRAEHDGGAVAFDRAVLATGTRPRMLPLPGATLPGVVVLRSVVDVERIRPRLARPGRLVIVGAGYIGLEVAAVARAMGHAVTVLEAGTRAMARVVAEPLSRFYQDLHASRGVDIHLGEGLAAIERRQGRLVAVGAGGGVHEADLILVAVGAVPNAELAADAGLAVDDGILVDAAARTSDPRVLAAGDCTRFPSARFGRTVRLESVQNAIDQGKAAAAALVGAPADYDPVPWFWSDQFDVKLQIAGLSGGHDAVVLRGDPAAHAFSAFYLRGSRLLAVDSVNRPRDHMLARRLVGGSLAAAKERLADADDWSALFAPAAG